MPEDRGDALRGVREFGAAPPAVVSARPGWKLTHRAHGRLADSLARACGGVATSACAGRYPLGSPSSDARRPRRGERSAQSGRPPRRSWNRNRRYSCCHARGRGPRRSRSASHPGRDRRTGRCGEDSAARALILDRAGLKLDQEAPSHHAARTVPRKQDRGSRGKRQAARRAVHALTIAHGRHPAGQADEDLGLPRRIMRPLQSRRRIGEAALAPQKRRGQPQTCELSSRAGLP
jgi:hypothetical protein